MFECETPGASAELVTELSLHNLEAVSGGEEPVCFVTSPPPTCTSDGKGHITCTPIVIACTTK